MVTPAIATKIPANFIAFGIHLTAVTEPDRLAAHGVAEAFGQNTELTTTYNPTRDPNEMAAIFGGAQGPAPEVILLIGYKPIPKQQ